MIDRAGNLAERAREDFEIGYRHVAFKGGRLGENAWFVDARFRFRRGAESKARARIRDLLARRVASQPLNLPNAGSVFRNPPGGYAAQLVEACGLKGYAVGGASVSEKHANFIVNPKGRATATDIETLIGQVRETVRAKFGVDLVPEVRIIGDAAGRVMPRDGATS